MAALGYLVKLKRALGLAFDVQFLHDFSIKMFLVLYSINGQSFNDTSNVTFFSQDTNKLCY